MPTALLRLLHFGEKSVVVRIAAVCVLVGLVFAAATTAIGYSKASSGLREQGEARLESDAVGVTRSVDAWTEEHLQLAHSMADLPAVHRFLKAGDAPTAEDTEFLNSIGVSLKEGMSDVTGFTLIDANGISRITQGHSLGQSHANRDYYQNAIKGHDFISGVSQKESDGTPTIFIAAPVKDADGHVIGVAQSSGDPTGLQRLLDAEHQRMGAASRSLLIDEEGLIVANTIDPSWFLRPVVALSPDVLKADEHDKRWGRNPTPDAVGEQDLAPIIGTTNPVVFDWHSQGNTYRAIAMPLGNTHWTYITALPTTTFEASSQDLLRTSALAILVGLVLAIGAMILLTRPLAKALSQMTAAANRLAEGDVDEQLAIAGEDEIGQMGAAFEAVRAYLRRLANAANRMADGDLTQNIEVASDRDSLGLAFARMQSQLQQIVGEVQIAAAGVAETSANVKASTAQTGTAAQHVASALENVARGARETTSHADETNTAVAQLNGAIDGIARGAADQAQQVQSASATATRMANGVEQVAAKASSVAAASEQTRASAEHGATAVRETVAGMGEIKAVVVEAANKVNELGRLGERIGQVVETIDDIAEQTNLLALNAAIEAARAGEHGRGFAVVADEVRKLAERSSRETRQIAELIREVQTATHEAVGSMQQGATRVEQGSAKADLAGRALGEILSAVETTVQHVNEIAESAQEMASASRGMVAAMESISAVVEENTASTEEMAAQALEVSGSIQRITVVSQDQSAAAEAVSTSTEEMAAQVDVVTAQANELAVTADQLRQLVATFKLAQSAEVEDTKIVPLRRAA